ncbi:MAG: hypothetical protein ACO1QS_15105 [Verrucomicrobiota bacterium]
MKSKRIESWHCPGCREPLQLRSVMDPYLQGLHCAKGHRYCQIQRMAAIERIDHAGKLKPQYPAGAKLEDRVKFWFGDETCREHLFSQIATIVRRIYEITVEGDEALGLAQYAYCPICAGDFEGSFQTSDGHRIGSICTKGHRFAMYGEMSSDDDHGVFLKAEPDRGEIKTYAEIYVTKRYARCVHADLREFMQRYLEGLPEKRR